MKARLHIRRPRIAIRCAVAALLTTSTAAPSLAQPTRNDQPAPALPIPAALQLPAPQGLTAVEYRTLYEKGRDLSAARKWAELIPVARQLIGAYPYDGMVWRWLGLASSSTNDPATAATAFEQSLRFGLPAYGYHAAANAARAYARLGNAERASYWLAQALDEHRHVEPDKLLAEEVFSPIRSHPSFAAIAERRLGRPATTRTERWQADIDFYVDEVRRIKRTLSLQTLQQLSAAAEVLKARVPSLTDAEIYTGIDELAAMQKQGHNFLSDYKEESPLASPIQTYAFADGVHVVKTDEAHNHLLGARVLNIGKVSIEEALRRASRTIVADNDMAVLMHMSWKLGSPTYLKTLGIIDDPQRWSVKLRLPNGRQVVETLQPIAGQLRPEPLPTIETSPKPLYLRSPEVLHWMEDLPDGSLYVQVNRIRDAEGKTLDAFGAEVLQRLNSRTTDSAILDLRLNIGGDSYKYRELLRAFIAWDMQPNTQLYVISGRATQSATVNLISELDRLTDAIIAGEPFEGKPSAPGDAVQIVLPYSKRGGGISSTTWGLTGVMDSRVWIAPTLPVTLSSADYFANRDPVLAAIQEHILRRRQAARTAAAGEQ
ncbi:MAG TPA: hypothetical protein VGB59_01550 [Allosphingosinicella sp.]|jgi:tetratricopeptide (TPR) repeat protein